MDPLPEEIIAQILNYLPTKDLLQFLRAFEKYRYFLREKQVIQFFSLRNMFELNSFDVCQFILTNVAYKYIKVLNIDRLYWIPLQDVRKLISKLENLEELYAIDTSLGIRSKDIYLYGKLKKLSVSVEANQLDNGNSNFCFNCLYGLKKLCLKLILKKDNFEELYCFFGALKQLRELWIYDTEEQYGINYERIVANLTDLNKLVIKSQRTIPFLDLSCWGLVSIFQSKRNEFAVEIIFERISLINIREPDIPYPKSPIEKAWEVYKSLHCEMPWGSNDFELQKIALSVEDNQFAHSTVIASKKLKSLKSLCLKITEKKEERSGIYLFFREIKHLEELWIYDDNESNCRIDYYQFVVMLKKLKKFVIKSKAALPYYDFKCDSLFPTFECKRSGSATEYIFEKILTRKEDPSSIFEPKQDAFERSWDLFERLHKDLPCGPKESKQVYLKKGIKSIYFEDLNFCHAVILCNSKYIDAALQVLTSKNSTKLKRLSFRSCLFQDFQKDKQNVQTSGFKRPRRGVQINSAQHPFRKVAKNINCLTELEISTCPGCSGEAVLSAYPLIDIFQNLKKLTLEVPLLMDGSFFKEVFVKCAHLESLNLTCVAQNEKFFINLCQNLKYAINLRDFRLDHRDIIIDRLLDSFNEIENKKLLRIFLKCDTLNYGSTGNQTEAFFTFMTNNPQLVFFLLIATKNIIKQNSEIQKVLNSFKKGNPAKVFYINNNMSPFTGVFPIPTAHRDMIFNSTNVSVISIDDF